MVKSVFWLSLALLLLANAGCGTVGPPIPPENVGVVPQIEQQRQREMREGELAAQQHMLEGSTELQDPQAIPQDEVLLPPLRPVGTR